MNEIKLGDIATISSGLVLRRYDSKPYDEEEDKGKKIYYVVNQKSVEENYLNPDHFEKVTFEKKIEKKYLTKKGDIVMKLNSPYSAASVIEEYSSLITSSLLATIVPNEEYNPVYVALMLNSQYVKKQLNKYINENKLAGISIKNLREIKIKHIPLEEQEMYGKLISSFEQKKRLALEKIVSMDKVKNNIINEIR